MILEAGLLLILQSSEPEFDLRVEAWFPSVAGWMQFDEKPAVGDRVDLVDDLGADRAAVPVLAGRVSWSADRLSLTAVRVRWEAEATMDRDRRWNESQFSAGETVETRYDQFEGELAWEHRIVSGGVDVWAGVAARYIRFDVVLESPSQGRDDDHAITFAPAAVAAVSWKPRSDFSADLQVQWTYLPTSEMEVQGLAAQASVEWEPVAWMALRVGWRAEGLRLTKDNSLEKNDLRSELGGFTAGLRFDF